MIYSHYSPVNQARMPAARPIVLCCSGHDPSGGAGIQADIEAVLSHRCQPVSVVTALTEQDSSNVYQFIPQNPEDFLRQAKILLADISVQAIKIGLLGSPEIALALRDIILKYPKMPVVLDPVLSAGGGQALSNQNLVEVIARELLPLVSVLTPNSQEARKLCGMDDLHDCGLALLDLGCKYVLITGGHEVSPLVTNHLFYNGRLLKSYDWRRLPHQYHGSGCTLAASIAALLTRGMDVSDAIYKAQEYTFNALASGFKPGAGQHLPNRFYWQDAE